MEYRELGKTGLKVSRVGFGGLPLQRVDAAETKKIVKSLLDTGVNFIDTARAYSVSEGFLGEALEGVREKFVLATKSMARTKEEMERDIDISLKNLRTGYIDLYQIHNPNMEQLEAVMAEGGALEALEEARRAGKIGHIGVTAHSPKVFEKALDLPWAETIMFPYNVVERQGEEYIRACQEKNIGFIAMKPMAGGNIEDGSLAVRFILRNPAVTVAIPGMAAVSEVEENAAAADDHTPLSEREKEEMAALEKELGTQFCRRCNYCAPCTAGIAIPNVFLFAGYLRRYDLAAWSKSRYDSQAVKADACVDCGVCEERCPYHLPIREMLKQAHTALEAVGKDEK
ncbi:aldo/keto reductase [Lacrimispora sp. NSJ-141]|uniref:Aldo/keto reductase n=1 Tax=Lientehia hominis TaxID=2897778 RepID=A0AAP2RK79_9FIRM|nr:aldo/keto reductase [Lientehia hominis]MCD2493160.1 aldo/keto reductase [Lientehia hominis]